MERLRQTVANLVARDGFGALIVAPFILAGMPDLKTVCRQG